MKKILYILSICFFLAGLVSCSEEMPADNRPQTSTKSVLIELPYAVQPLKSRAMPLGNAIRTLDVLAFTEDGRYLYRSESEPLYSIDNGQSYLYTIDIQQQETVGKQTFVFVANMHDKLTSLLSESGITKDELMSQLVFDNCNWNESKTGIPMWGQTSVPYDVTAAPDVLDKICLLRSVAVIDILVNGNLSQVNGLDNFKLSDVILKDFESKGCVAPNKSNYKWENGSYTITAPSIPEESVSYDGYTISIDSPGSSIQEKVFVPEFDASTEGKTLPSLLIGGYYGSGNTTEKSWYKVNIVKDGSPINILRNTRYVLNITEVSAKGFNSADEAYANPSQNIRATINLTSDMAAGLTHIVYDHSNFLAVSETDVQLIQNSSSQIELLTNVVGGWSFTSVPEWIEVSGQNGTKDERASITINANSTSETLRMGVIEVVAGGLTMQINIKEAESNEITYTAATAQEVINAETLGIPASEFKLSNGVAFYDKYIYIGNSYYKIENSAFTKRQKVLVYDTETKEVVNTIEEWTHNDTTLNFEGTTDYPETLDDIVADPRDKRLYVMRRHSCVEVFDISNPANPVYVTRIGKSMKSTDYYTTFRNSSAVGVCDRAVLIRAAKVLNTYERNTITSANWSNITSKTSENRNMLDLGYQPRQFAVDPVTGKVWLTEFGNDSFKGIYKLDVNRMNNFGNKVYQYCDLRDGSISLDSNPTGMVITDKKVYITKNNGTIDVFDRSVLDLSSTRSTSKKPNGQTPERRAVPENFVIGNMIKLYPGNEEEAFWTCDTKNNALVLVKIGTGTIIM